MNSQQSTNEKTAQLLEEALKRMNGEGGKHWIKGAYRSAEPADDGRYCFCSIGALFEVSRRQSRKEFYRRAVIALCDAYTPSQSPRESVIIRWNDDKRTTWPKVEKRFLRAITKLRKGA
jgi:hypothetical protein